MPSIHGTRFQLDSLAIACRRFLCEGEAQGHRRGARRGRSSSRMPGHWVNALLPKLLASARRLHMTRRRDANMTPSFVGVR